MYFKLTVKSMTIVLPEYLQSVFVVITFRLFIPGIVGSPIGNVNSVLVQLMYADFEFPGLRYLVLS